MAWTTPKTWTGSELLTASDLNQYVRDNLSVLYDLVAAGGRKNLLDNGQMQVHQRNTSVSTITTSGYYTADRWHYFVSNLGTWTQSVESDAPTGSGFRKSLKMYCSTADASPAAGDYAFISQKVEGQNLQNIKKGTASAEQVTLSFWTKSNKTGTYAVEIYDNDNTRHVAATYTVVSSGTWEEQSITFPADATGAFGNDAEHSLNVNFWLASGSDHTSGTLATTWAAYTAANRAVGQANLASANANYWQVTGVQLEIGDTATGFEHRPYGDELATCQRYAYVWTANSPVGVYAGWYWDTQDIMYSLQGVDAQKMRVKNSTGLTLTGIGTQGTNFGVYSGGVGATGFTFLTDYPQHVTARKTAHGYTTPWNTGVFGTMILSADL